MPARIVCAVALAGLCACFSVSLARSPCVDLSRLIGYVLLILGALLALSPVLNPWYLLWLLPLAALARAPGFWLACGALLLAHGSAGVLNSTDPDLFAVPVALQLSEYALLAAAALLQSRAVSKCAAQP
jgi:hypothetical protein